jgi:hypothetical protein
MHVPTVSMKAANSSETSVTIHLLDYYTAKSAICSQSVRYQRTTLLQFSHCDLSYVTVYCLRLTNVDRSCFRNDSYRKLNYTV